MRSEYKFEGEMAKKKCTICAKEVVDLRRHMIYHQKERKYECAMCPSKFQVKSNLFKHLRVHTNEKPFQCELCDKSFVHNAHLKIHIRTHTRKRPYKCDICHVRYRSSQHFKVHQMKEHQINFPGTAIQEYECEICKKIFYIKSHLKRHHQTVHAISGTPFECELCKRKLKTKCSLSLHMKRHQGDIIKTHACILCDKKFYAYSKLERHLRVHTGEQPFKCGTCGDSFNNLENLKIHRRIHTTGILRPFACLICKADFVRNFRLATHLKTVHSTVKPFVCDDSTCDKTFKIQADLRKHMRRVHTRNFKYWCVFCTSRGFPTKQHLFNHLLFHTRERPFICRICGSSFTYPGSFNRHLRQHRHTK